MKALLKKASDWDYHKNIEINSLEDLLKIHTGLIIESDEKVIELYKGLADGYGYSDDFEIIVKIYDDYVE